MADSPDIRIGTAEREQAMRRLSDHFAAGRLSVTEFDERSAVVAAAVTRGDLVQVFADLPESSAAEEKKPEQPRPGGPPAFRGPAMGLVVILAIVLFFVTNTWLWFLMIPAAGIVFGALGQGREDRRHDAEGRRQIAEEHRQELEEHRQEAQAHRLEIEQRRRELRHQSRELRHQRRDRRRGR
ncbi:hypothetical protein BJY24_003703 [Nocardia transvalensis]|uniref:DUF1707 domain-containing protein n=1 Tax=Nocardia transvalensis TaxID=37333 RepID=A0A7W9UJ08_9NOCA|nr:hypothetical protein [Nocardia transvalensis]